jgi:hypothetical protein
MLGGLAFVIILGALLTVKSCNAQNTPINIPTQEYNDASGKEFDHDGAILFFADGVIDFIYHTQDNEYIIEYDDPDAFDPDNMIYKKDGDYYYIEIHCDSTLFFEYLNYYNSLGGHKNPKFSEASEIYFIEEDFLENDESYYKLVKYATEKNL